MGPDFDFWFGLAMCIGLAISLILLLRKKVRLSSFWALLALATVSSLGWREWQLTEATSFVHVNSGVDPWDLAFDQHFIHRRAFIRFTVITATLVIGAIIHFIRDRKNPNST